MNIINTKFKLKERLKQNQFDLLFEELDSLIKTDSPLSNVYINLCSKYMRLKNNSLKGVLSHQEKEINYAKIVDTLTAIIDELSNADFLPDKQKIINPLSSEGFLTFEKKYSIRNLEIEYVYKYINVEEFEKILDKNNSLILVDLDDFTIINKKYGVEIGNEVLEKVREIIEDILPTISILAYTGGDEYILAHNSNESNLNLCTKILKEIQNYQWNEILQGLFIKATISFSERGIKKVQEKIYNDAKFIKEIQKEDIKHWMFRTIWGIKNGKIAGKNRVVKSPNNLPEQIKLIVHNVNYYDYGFS